MLHYPNIYDYQMNFIKQSLVHVFLWTVCENVIWLDIIYEIVCTPPLPDDTTEFLQRRADTTRNVACEDGLWAESLRRN